MVTEKSAASKMTSRQQTLVPLRFAFLASLVSSPISINMRGWKIDERWKVSAPLATQNFSFKCNLVFRKLFLPLFPPVALLLNTEMAFTFTFHPDLQHTHNRRGPFHPFPFSQPRFPRDIWMPICTKTLFFMHSLAFWVTSQSNHHEGLTINALPIVMFN